MSIHRVLRSIDPEVETEHFEAQIGSQLYNQQLNMCMKWTDCHETWLSDVVIF